MDERTSFSAAFAGASVAQAYEDLLVPRLFAPWAALLVRRVEPAQGGTAADVACGTGVVTRELARRVGPAGRVIGLDFSEGMLARASAVSGDAASGSIDYRRCPADSLLLDTCSIDVATCQQGFQFFPDVAAAARELHRVLRPGGRAAVAVWAPEAPHGVWRITAEVLDGLVGGDVARWVLVPFTFGGGRQLHDILVDAGFTRVVVETCELPLRLEEGADQAALVPFATPAADRLRDLDAAMIDRYRNGVRERFASLLDADGALTTPMLAHVALAER